MAIVNTFLLPSYSPGKLGTQVAFAAYAYGSAFPTFAFPVGVTVRYDVDEERIVTSIDPEVNVVPTAFSWDSSDHAVATIDSNGLATLVGAGSTDIKATATVGSNIATLTVASVSPPVWSVTFNNGVSNTWTSAQATH